MSEHQALGFLGRKILQAMNDEDGDLSQVRQENLNYYIGDEYGDEREGYSKFVTREVLETVEQVLPSVLRVFLSGDQIVAFDPVGPEDEDQARQETDITNHYVMKANRDGEGGFLTLHNWVKDALMNPTGYIKVSLEEKDVTSAGVMTGLTELGVFRVMQDKNIEIREQRSYTEQIEQRDPNTGEPYLAEIEIFDLKIRRTKKVKKLRIDPVPPEECLVDNDCTSPNLDTADFVCHRVRKTYSQLVSEGYDAEELDLVGTEENYQWNDERVNRLFYEDEDPDAEDEDDDSMRKFWVHECYAWYDYDGTGVAQHRLTTIIGDKIFENEEIDFQPMVSLSSILMQHKHTGMSFVEVVKDLQLLSSTLTRQLLDSIYKFNVGKDFINEDALTEDGSTMDALLNTQAEYVPVRGIPQNAVMAAPRQSIVQEILPVMEYVKNSRVNRTGVSMETAVDANSLQEVRQDVFVNALDRASQRIEMLVTIMAETGFRWLFTKVHQLLRSNWDVKTTIKLRGEWVPVDPQGWEDRTDLTVNVGLGFHTKHILLGILVQLLSIQKEATAAGLSDPAKIYNTLEKLVNAAGVGDVRMFFNDPEDPNFVPPEPQPDANMILAQAQAQALQQEQQRKGFEAQNKAQTDQQKAIVDVQMGARELRIKEIDQQIKLRELALKEVELRDAGKLADGQLAKIAAEIRNEDADTGLKRAQADKAVVDAAATAVEASISAETAGEQVEDASDETTETDTESDSD